MFALMPLHLEHLDTLASMVLAFYDEMPGTALMTLERAQRQALEILRQPSRCVALLIGLHEQVVGYALMVPYYSNEYGGSIVWIDELWIAPELRSQGLGAQVLDRLKAWSVEQGYGRIELEISGPADRLMRFYGRAGFKAEPRVLMSASLSAPVSTSLDSGPGKTDG